jgi:hypoxanthine-DNA glycosylase
VSDPSARVLVLGSMPGQVSLKAQQYYAHPRNAFWKILEGVTGVSPTAPYRVRTQGVIAARIALWDVLASCVRPGSLDADIVRASVQPNDFDRFFQEHPQIEVICFNGAAAEAEYLRHVAPLRLSAGARLVRLPSTSPAHAAMTFEHKARIWRSALQGTDF